MDMVSPSAALVDRCKCSAGRRGGHLLVQRLVHLQFCAHVCHSRNSASCGLLDGQGTAARGRTVMADHSAGRSPSALSSVRLYFHILSRLMHSFCYFGASNPFTADDLLANVRTCRAGCWLACGGGMMSKRTAPTYGYSKVTR